MALSSKDEQLFREIANWYRHNKDKIVPRKEYRQAKIVGGGVRLKIGKADADILKDTSGTISIWNGDPLADSGDNETAHLDWMHGDEQVSAGKEVLIAWFADESKWRIIGAECE